MYQLGRLTIAAMLCGGLAAASPLAIVSNGSMGSQTNNSCQVAGVNSGNCDTQNIDKHPAWANPSAGSNWVSFAQTGNDSGADFISNGIDVEFYHPFVLPTDWDSAEGSISVMGDDTAQVLMLREVFKRWNIDAGNDNEADAAGLAMIGRAYLDESKCENQAQRDVITALRTPKVNFRSFKSHKEGM